MKIGILITNYNTWDMTSLCITNCLKFADANLDQIVVVDDCSSEKITNPYKEVELIKNKQNIGLIRSLNLGVKKLNTDLILIFDSDAWPLEEYLKKVKHYFLQNPSVGIATFQTFNSNGKATQSYELEPGVLSLLLGQQLYDFYLKKFVKKPLKINVFTCAMVVRKEVFQDIGVFDENFDWLELDHDLCMRASRKGWKMGVMPIQAFHAGSGTPQKVSHRVIRYYKNRWYLLKKFNKVKLETLTVGLISFRLILEFLFVWIFGFFFFRKLDVVRDKAYSRKMIIKYFIGNLWSKRALTQKTRI